MRHSVITVSIHASDDAEEAHTEDRNAVGSGRHRLADHQQEDDERQQDGRLEIDLLAGLDGQEEAEERDEEDEEAGRDEVDDVEEAAAAHVDRERHVGVRLHAAGVELDPRVPRRDPFCVEQPRDWAAVKRQWDVWNLNSQA